MRSIGWPGARNDRRKRLRKHWRDDAAVGQREAEIQRLERLVWDAIYVLQKASIEKESNRLRRT
jgi:hypothetical protein